jgi:hypothetical protein
MLRAVQMSFNDHLERDIKNYTRFRIDKAELLILDRIVGRFVCAPIEELIIVPAGNGVIG